MQEYTVTLKSRKQIADNMYELHFDKPEGFQYRAGQFIQFVIPQGDTSTVRSYSISSMPNDPDLEFCIELIPGGIGSTHIIETMQEGDTISMRGPNGRLVANKNATYHYFVATGSGLAPIMGILRDELETNGSNTRMRLLFGVRYEEDIFWNDRLAQLASKYENFSYQICLSKPKNLTSVPGALEGRVTAHIDSDIGEAHVYLCGAAAMIMDMRKIAIEKGVDPRNVHMEIFT